MKTIKELEAEQFSEWSKEREIKIEALKDVLGLIDEMPVTGYIRDVEPAIVLTDFKRKIKTKIQGK